MEKCRERLLKRINGQYKAVSIFSLIVWGITSVIAFITGGFMPGIVLFVLFTIVMMIAALPMMFQYKKSMDVVTHTNPVICTVTRADMRYISSKRMHQAAFFIYDDEECYGIDYEKELHEIEAGQQLYVWKVTKKRYEISHIE